MAITPKISVVDKVSYDFFSKMAKKNKCEFYQFKMNDNLTGNFLMNETTFDCFLTKGDKVFGGQGFKTSDPVSYAKNMLKTILKLPCSEATKIRVFEELA